jgi:hypothetical protein
MNLENAQIIGHFSLPTNQEQNPSQFNSVMRELNRNIDSGLGACEHCGTGIIHHVVVAYEGRRVAIGSKCAEKCGLTREQVKEAQSTDHLNLRLSPEDRAARKAKVDAWKQRQEDERIEACARDVERAKVLKARRKSVATIYARLMLIKGNDFADSLASQLWTGRTLSSRQAECVCKMLSATGRRNKKNADEWDAMADLCCFDV